MIPVRSKARLSYGNQPYEEKTDKYIIHLMKTIDLSAW